MCKLDNRCEESNITIHGSCLLYRWINEWINKWINRRTIVYTYGLTMEIKERDRWMCGHIIDIIL